MQRHNYEAIATVCTTRLATVIVRVHHLRDRRRPLSDLMGVVRRGRPGPDVQELPDTCLRDQEAHRPGLGRPAAPGPQARTSGVRGDGLPANLAALIAGPRALPDQQPSPR